MTTLQRPVFVYAYICLFPFVHAFYLAFGLLSEGVHK
jgi:hypothetical protein